MKGLYILLMTAFVCAFSISSAYATIRLPALISNNMILQQNDRVKLWGWAEGGEKISITTSWNQATTHITANSDGSWQTTVKTSAAGGPFMINFVASNSIQVENVLLGEVWVASGQSNMEFFVGKTRSPSYTGVVDYEQEIKGANYPMIRQIDVGNKNADQPQNDFKGTWKICTPQTVDTFSAVAYYFAKKLHESTGFPVGIINSTWGGTTIESWMKQEVLANDTEFVQLIDKYDRDVKAYPGLLSAYTSALDTWKLDTTAKKPTTPIKPNPDKSPFRLYNAMIAPIVNYTIKGVIWYQGENNAPRAYQYRRLFPAMISSWRKDFDKPDLPFYFVQISPHRSQNPELREAQLLTYRSVAHTGMAVTTDNGDSLNIHPRNKKLVGERLSLWALHNEYGKKNFVYSGPLYKSMRVDGNKIRISFDFAEGGLVAQHGAALREFTIAGSDQHFMPAQAEIRGKEVIVWSEEVTLPAAVRFAWRNVPEPNLYNKAGLPASPFRTDKWKGETEGRVL